MGRASQQKGRRAEIELATILNRHGYDTRPGVPCSFGSEPDLVGLPGIHAELKRREAVDISAALRQAQEDAEYFGGVPVLFCRGNREAWRVVMGLEDWLQLYRAYAEKEENLK